MLETQTDDGVLSTATSGQTSDSSIKSVESHAATKTSDEDGKAAEVSGDEDVILVDVEKVKEELAPPPKKEPKVEERKRQAVDDARPSTSREDAALPSNKLQKAC